jgi:hypothetical protein
MRNPPLSDKKYPAAGNILLIVAFVCPKFNRRREGKAGKAGGNVKKAAGIFAKYSLLLASKGVLRYD